SPHAEREGYPPTVGLADSTHPTPLLAATRQGALAGQAGAAGATGGATGAGLQLFLERQQFVRRRRLVPEEQDHEFVAPELVLVARGWRGRGGPVGFGGGARGGALAGAGCAR